MTDTNTPEANHTGSGCLVFFIIVVIGCGGFYSSCLKSEPKSQLEIAEENANNNRKEIAFGISRALKEEGCVDCKALADKDVFVITNPDWPPKQTAALILGTPAITLKLKEAGFRTLRVKQDPRMFADGFDYELK